MNLFCLVTESNHTNLLRKTKSKKNDLTPKHHKRGVRVKVCAEENARNEEPQTNVLALCHTHCKMKTATC
jgi:hypothetical protein